MSQYVNHLLIFEAYNKPRAVGNYELESILEFLDVNMPAIIENPEKLATWILTLADRAYIQGVICEQDIEDLEDDD